MNYTSFARKDYRLILERPRRRRLTTGHWLLLAVALLAGVGFTLLPEHQAAATRAGDIPQSPDPAPAYAKVLPLPPAGATVPAQAVPATAPRPGPADTAADTPTAATAPEPAPAITAEPERPAAAAGTWHEVTVASGDNLALIFDRLGLSPRELHDALAAGGPARRLTRIHPGETLRVRVHEGRLQELRYELNALESIQVARAGDGFEAGSVHRVPERRVTAAAGTIDSSLFLSAQAAGLSDSLTMELAGIFGWDVDFVLDIRAGDRFALIYEELYLDGEKIGNGDILAAEFINQGRRFRAVRFADAEGRADYYTPEGNSVRRAFLRTPVAFSRISSRFSLGRKHPILNRIRAHKGVDYAAPRGTPVKATGDGKIVHRGRKGGYGRAVIIKHGTRYSTLYAHLNGYARGLGVGSRVRQGQVIGYVGSSGLATGPHLHYEFRVNGVHRNPLTVQLPSAEPLPERYREDFQRRAGVLVARLEQAAATTVALNSRD